MLAQCDMKDTEPHPLTKFLCTMFYFVLFLYCPYGMLQVLVTAAIFWINYEMKECNDLE